MESQSINRKDLTNIYNLSCVSNKRKIEKHLNKSKPVININNDEILEYFLSVCKNREIEMLEKYFYKPKPITERIKSFEDACKYLEISENNALRNIKDNHMLVAQLMLETIIKALNSGWKANPVNKDQIKFFNKPYICDDGFFYLKVESSDLSPYNTLPSLYLKDKDLAIYTNKTFFNLYKKMYTGKSELTKKQIKSDNEIISNFRVY